MNTIDRTVAALMPEEIKEASLSLPDTSYDERIAAIIATPRQAPARTRRSFFRLPLVLTASAAAATAAAVTIPLLGDADPHLLRPAERPLDARTFLLSGAKSIEKAPQTTGKYWHVKTRRCTREGKTYRYVLCVTTESWKSKTGFIRTVVGLNPKVTFPSAKDKAAWKAAGSPNLVRDKPAYTEYSGPEWAEWGVNGKGMSLDQLLQLPTTPEELRKVIAKSAEGGTLSSTQVDGFLWTFAPELLSQPTTPATRAGIYRMLAQIKGVRTVGTATDPEGGPPAIVLSYTENIPPAPGAKPEPYESRLAFRKNTYEYLGEQSNTGMSLSNAQLTAEWTDTLGPRQGERGQS
ncbi:hypothetical protein Acsp03_20090 [Actinomadura sp. NBRC 104412]|uniref:CU044_5270 family protein n=1 Tax=Actinomadura sp. NBRC 104412 TaxID=3032203 RepID=UPI0024A5874F|nr:CU044_5270 family protein [Actinomadura sp. NBRC 104412]GLZ04543.1 hypothetical protein Acsp03_20090 [Actinomadura sp. NBRC 104412]